MSHDQMVVLPRFSLRRVEEAQELGREVLASQSQNRTEEKFWQGLARGTA
jgi:hypothetical protein